MVIHVSDLRTIYFLINIVNQKFMIEFSVDLRVNFKSTDLLYPVADGGQDLMVESPV